MFPTLVVKWQSNPVVGTGVESVTIDHMYAGAEDMHLHIHTICYTCASVLKIALRSCTPSLMVFLLYKYLEFHKWDLILYSDLCWFHRILCGSYICTDIMSGGLRKREREYIDDRER